MKKKYLTTYSNIDLDELSEAVEQFLQVDEDVRAEGEMTPSWHALPAEAVRELLEDFVEQVSNYQENNAVEDGGTLDSYEVIVRINNRRT